MVNSCTQALGTLFSCWKAPDSQDGAWSTISVRKFSQDGKQIETFSRKYNLEKSTGDLYRSVDEEGYLDTPSNISLKAIGILIATPFYALGVIAANICKIAVDISSLFWRVIPNAYKDFSQRGTLASLGNILMSALFLIPTSIGESLWRIVRTPFYATGMMLASGYAIIQPLEGRKWIGKIELQWHQVRSKKWDFRSGPQGLQEESCLGTCWEWLKRIPEGKFIFLAYCMQKRGNLSDRCTNGTERFNIKTRNNNP